MYNKTNEELVLNYYSLPGLMTDPGDHTDLLEGLTSDPGLLCQVVQGCLLHVFWADQYGLELSEQRKQEIQIRSVSRKLDRIRQLDPRPLVKGRPLESKLVSNCRDFTLLLTTLFQHQGIPARARCGYVDYFVPDRYEEHWVCEYWNSKRERWVQVDSQLDALQRQALEISFDPLDIPHSHFLPGGKAWQMCRAGEVDPENFGIFELHGIDIVQGDMVRDFLALNKIEILPRDTWGFFKKKYEDLSPEELSLLDHLAALTLAGDEAFSKIQSLYQNNRELHIPDDLEL
jgi:hypothetical protein